MAMSFRRSSISDFLWAALLVTLPITSLPLLAALWGNPVVSPASIIPLALLVVIWLVPFIYGRGRLPKETSPLLFFLLFAALTSGLALFLSTTPFKGRTPLDREIRAIATLLLGIAFYAVTSTYVRNWSDLIKAIRLINIGAVALLIWAAVQSAFILFNDGYYPNAMIDIHRLISVRDPTQGRVVALAYEPSWLGNMLNLLYYPIWIGFVLTGRSAYKNRFLGLPFEVFFVASGAFAVFLGQSRIGMIGFIVLSAFVAVTLAWRAAEKVRLRIIVGSAGQNTTRALSALISLGTAMLVLVVFVILSYTLIYVAAKLEWGPEALFDAPVVQAIRKDPFYIFSYPFARELRIAERAAYWRAALEVFKDHPIIGVGLGNVGYYFPEGIPAFGWRAPEVIKAVSPITDIFPNAKNLWLRLLGETGIVGFTIFVVWLVLIALRSSQLRKSHARFGRTMGTVGFLALISVLVEGFSVDSFTFPYMWISLGLVSAAAMIAADELSSSKESP